MKNTKVLVEELEQGKYDSVLLDLYVDAEKLDYQRKRYIETIKKYEETFGEGEVEIYSAPGRSEVGGNHTDHQHGMVLATSYQSGCTRSSRSFKRRKYSCNV